MSHIVNKNGQKTLYVFYQDDGYDAAIEEAVKKHGLENVPVTIIAKPYKKDRSLDEKSNALRREFNNLIHQSIDREMTEQEEKLCNSLIRKQIKLQEQIIKQQEA